jgi:hypothetical protein
MGHYRTIPINRIIKWPLPAVDMRPCKIPEDEFLEVMAANAALRPVEPRAACPNCEALRQAWNRAEDGQLRLIVLCGVLSAMLLYSLKG